MIKRILAGIGVALAFLALLYFNQSRPEPFVVSGFIEADEIRLGSRVGGRVSTVRVAEGSLVKAGELLIELEPFDLLDQRARLQAEADARKAELDRLTAGYRAEELLQAEARRDHWRAQLDKLRSGPRKAEIAAARSRLELAEAGLSLAQSEFERRKSLAAEGVISSEELDRATEALRVAEQTSNVQREQLRLLEEGTREEEIREARARLAEAEAALQWVTVGFRREEIEAAQAAFKAAEAARSAVDRQIDELTIEAPVDGQVEALDLQPGDLVAPGAPVLSMIDRTSLWVRAFVPENRMALQPGQKVWIAVDSFPGRRFAAHLSFLARQAEFTPGNVQTPEERSKQVFRIKATLDEGLDELRPGMSADVEFDSPRDSK